MDLPNEVTLNIVSCLSKKDLKQVRLVCRLWAALGAKSLFDTIYVSPREFDMSVFEAITQHQTLRHAPRHLVYDSAVFERLTEAQYACDLHWQYHAGDFDILGDARFQIEEMIRFISVDILDGTVFEVNQQLKSHPVYENGFREYFKYANEYLNLFTKRWSGRVYRGLKNLGPIVSVTIRNTWEMIYDLQDDNNNEMTRSYNCPPRFKHQVVSICYDVAKDGLVSRNCIQSDGTRLVGSPSARTYPATGLPPHATQDWDTMGETQMMTTSSSSGYYEFLEIVDLLNSAGKRPKNIIVVGGLGMDGFRTGISAQIFDPQQNLDPRGLLDLASGLTSLQLTIADNVHEENYSLVPLPSIGLLGQFLWRARSLEVLSLDFPCNLGNIDSTIPTSNNLCKLSSVAQPWLPTGLKVLYLNGFTASYRELGTHLFLCLPSLVNLIMGVFSLNEGCYEDLIKGLRHHIRLQNFQLGCHILSADGNGVLPPGFIKGVAETQDKYCNTLSDFATMGQTLPGFGIEERDVLFNEWLQQMKTEENQLMSAYIGQDTSGRRQQNFPRSAEFLRFVAKAVANYKNVPSMYK
ncbi:MAG: hypothetical protein LQ337_007300 [Flavoplaca oasis]|nr:MAG: hypothetical protein LQ337_007300 [Flavoplaca oasis]